MLRKKIQEDIVQGVKDDDKTAVSTLRMLSAVVLAKEKEKRYRISKGNPDIKNDEIEKESRLNDEEIIELVSSEIKKRKEAALAYERGKRPELAEKEKKEIKVLMRYLPDQLSKEEIEEIVKQALEKTGAKEIKEMGRVMAEIMPKIKGRADAAEVSEMVKSFLT